MKYVHGGKFFDMLLDTIFRLCLKSDPIYNNEDQGYGCTCFGSTYTKIGTIQRRLAWPLRKDNTQIREAFHIFLKIN